MPFLFLRFDQLSGSSLLSNSSYLSDDNYVISIGVQQLLLGNKLTFEIQHW